MNRFWTIPVLTVYIYTITILMMYGYNSYFNIPYSFINASITDNVVYLRFLAVIFWGVMGTIKWYHWILTSLFLLITIGLGYVFLVKPKTILSFLLLVFMTLFLYTSVNFGEFLAMHQPNFFVLSEECKTINTDKNYIIQSFYNNNVILVPIDANKKLHNGFLVKNTSELGCEIQMSYGIGPITH